MQGIRYALRLAAGAVLTASLSVSTLALAANTATSSGKAKKTVVAKAAEKSKRPTLAKSVTAKSPSGARTAQKSAGKKVVVATARGSKNGSAQAKSSVERSAKLAKAGRPDRLARATGQKKQALRLASGKNRPSAQVDLLAASVVRVPVEPRVSTGERLGLRASHDALDLNSSVALVVDQETSEVLFSKNDTAVLPIASLTKLMTGLVIADAHLSLDEQITITDDDAMVYRNSRLAVGTTLSRGELMHLALMSSENRAANALGRTFPGGSDQFVRLMNAKARELGMRDTRYVEPTGLSSQNQSSARDLATLVSVAYERPILRSLSTSPSHQLELGHRTLQYNNSNRLIRNPEWEIGLQKTGYISEAGRCLVMQAKVAGRKLIMVFLDSAGKLSRAQDAERVRRWVEAQSIQQSFARPQG
ncbi:D-alanyl-D-alanine carboxypeptidase family protein [Hydrogenophaga sp.]|uniref:D-alanyl-D-alanine carboxypeptidase family protein n=1 Tax=Hydrogenophaga sp. TaxID=1904254 RepID=UPI00286E3D00|nr:serine hydrolase [Hydrogenophaga sp.]